MQKIAQSLYSLLDSDINRKKYRYLLIDNLATISELDFIHLDNLTQLLGEQAITTLIRPELAHSPQDCPKLITIAKKHQALDQTLIDYSLIQAIDELNRTKRYICSWLVSQHPAELVADLYIKIGVTFGARCQLPFIPLYEPFRFQLLHESNQTSPHWLPFILNFCDSYYYLKLDGQLCVVESLQRLPPDIDTFVTETSLFYQRHARQIFQLYAGWQRYCQQTSQIINNETLINVAKAYHRACSAGLTHRSDMTIFAMMTLRYGNLLDQTPLQQAVNDAIEEPGILANQFKSVDQQVFLDLQQQ